MRVIPLTEPAMHEVQLHTIPLMSSVVSGTRPSEKRKEGLGNRLGWKCTIWNIN